MRYILLLLFLIAFKFASSQNLSADFPDSNYFYNESRAERGSDMTPFNTIDYSIYYKKDTFVNNIKYHLLYIKFTIEYFNPGTPRTNADHEFALLRNDKQNKKVYLKGLKSMSFNLNLDTNETLYYDFDLKVGDNYKAHLRSFYTNDSLFVNKIDTIIDPDNIKRAVYTISTRNNTDEMMNGKVIQGIGGYNGLIGYITFIWNNVYGESFSCYNINGKSYEAYFGVNSSIISNPNNCILHRFVSVDNKKEDELKVYPNPAIDNIYFNLNDEVKQIRIYDDQGRLVLNDTSNANHINIENLSAGLYLLQLITNKNVYHSKFDKQ